MRRQPATFAQRMRIRLAVALYAAGLWALLLWIFNTFFGAGQ